MFNLNFLLTPGRNKKPLSQDINVYNLNSAQKIK